MCKIDLSASYPELHKYAGGRGGVFTPISYYSQLNIIHEGTIRNLHKQPSGLIKPIHETVLFLENHNDKLNAYAVLEEVPMIVIGRAAFFILRDYFYRFLSNKNILKKIGNSENEIIDSPSLNKLAITRTDFKWTIDPQTYNSEHPKPICPKRYAAAHFCVDVALRFIWSHELHHYLHGHLAYLKSAQGASVIEETKSNVKDSILSIALEMDADSSAAQRTLMDVIKLYRGSSIKFCDNIYELIGLYLFAINTLFITMGSNFYDTVNAQKYDISKSSHPTPGMRFLTVNTAIAGHIHNVISSLDVEKMWNISQPIGYQAIDAYKKTVVNFSPFLGSDDGFLNSEEEALSEKMHNKWSEIRDDLQTHSYLLLPPAKRQSFK